MVLLSFMDCPSLWYIFHDRFWYILSWPATAANVRGWPYDTSENVTRKVYKDCQVAFDGNRYVIPHKYVGKKVLLKVNNGMIRIFHNEELLVTYLIP
ncbi:Mu transposase domain-containing protein [Candidatus Magnetominusculus xianensis]|uniref:Integrase n=1 Tax=Candidatus Magnetominusculus xianensis TaxID=1748249 RepID=A0ABR5SAY4_9BACT|nr:integrase [Candidatus Magnetominusculus xianensis]